LSQKCMDLLVNSLVDQTSSRILDVVEVGVLFENFEDVSDLHAVRK